MKTFTLALCLALFSVVGFAQEKKMPQVQIGQTAPNFTVNDVMGQPVNLHQTASDRKVLLSFFRYAGCPVCHYRMHELQEEYATLQEQGWEMILVFETPEDVLLQYKREYNLPFVMISDPENELYDLYAVERSTGKMLKTARQKEVNQRFKKGKEMYTTKYKRDGKMNRIGADFVVGSNGKVLRAHYGEHIGDHIPIADFQSIAGK